MSRIVVGDHSGKANESAGSPPPIVRLLQLAEELKRELDAGRNRYEIASRHGVSRPRITQILNLLRLHPAILGYLRSLRAGAPVRLVTERKLRALIPLSAGAQLEGAAALLPSFKSRRPPP